MNEYDSNRIYDLTSKIGFTKTEIKKDANCIVLNTCNIREKAKEKVYDEIGRIKKSFKNLKKPIMIISGCVAQAESNEMIRREPYIDMVIGPQSYHKITDLILKYKGKKQKFNETEFDVIKKFDELQKIPHSENKISSYVTIQEGCDKFCNFCVVPYTRGPEHSRSFKQIIKEAGNLIDMGTKEIVLLGQNVNAYNFVEQKKSYKLSSIIRELNSLKKISRIRYTTSHPKDMTNDLIDCFKDCKKLSPFLHLPIQSGSNEILKKMNRKHTREYYLSIIEKLNKANKDIKISSDFIVGYPGETEKDFENTIDLIKEVGFINSYSFIFSPRPGTPAATKKVNNKSENLEKLKKLQSVLETIQINNNKNYLNKYCEILVENKVNENDKYFGRTKYMTPIIFESKNINPGDLVNVKVTSYSKKSLFGFSINNKIKAA